MKKHILAKPRSTKQTKDLITISEKSIIGDLERIEYLTARIRKELATIKEINNEKNA
tara:strand:+ start:512 stop:682 length:171 start_codon:yes stop_codon:yes gene_type:complete